MAMTEEKFMDVNELYKRISPALNTKVSELKRIKINVSKRNIWEYCLKNIWSFKKDLRIYEMVDDILNISVEALVSFLKNNN